MTFVPLACSGASISTGMLGPYAGIAPSGGVRLAPQVDAMKALVGSRRVDAVLVSIGINDLGFGNVARFCFDDGVDATTAAGSRLLDEALPDGRRRPPRSRTSSAARAAALPDRYAQLADALQKAGIPAAKVYVTEYPDPTRDGHGMPCDPLIPYLDSRPFGFDVRGTITRTEAVEGRERAGRAGQRRAEGGGRGLRLAPRLRDRGAVGGPRRSARRGPGSSASTTR